MEFGENGELRERRIKSGESMCSRERVASQKWMESGEQEEELGE